VRGAKDAGSVAAELQDLLFKDFQIKETS
jgi:hypothetical protein